MATTALHRGPKALSVSTTDSITDRIPAGGRPRPLVAPVRGGELDIRSVAERLLKEVTEDD
jgi:hypothetical protein